MYVLCAPATKTLPVYVFICSFAAHLQQMWRLQQQPNVSYVAVPDLPGAAGGEREERSENEMMAPISENMSFFPSYEPLCSFTSSRITFHCPLTWKITYN